MNDAQLASDLSQRAGASLMDLRASAGDTFDPDELGRAADRRANTILLDALAVSRPEDCVLSEEAADDPRRLGAKRVWIVDPLDGTREYSMGGRTDWAVHVALWQLGTGITDAAVAQPAISAVYSTAGPWNLAPRGSQPLSIVVSESRPPSFIDNMADELGAAVVPMGSAGAKAMAVLRGEADAYVHAGGQWEWDSAAPAGVLLAAGFHASRLDGSPLEYNRPRPYLPDLLMCRPEIAGDLLSVAARFYSFPDED